MKKLANLTALFIFVSVNVLTPVSYAQEVLDEGDKYNCTPERAEYGRHYLCEPDPEGNYSCWSGEDGYECGYDITEAMNYGCDVEGDSYYCPINGYNMNESTEEGYYFEPSRGEGEFVCHGKLSGLNSSSDLRDASSYGDFECSRNGGDGEEYYYGCRESGNGFFCPQLYDYYIDRDNGTYIFYKDTDNGYYSCDLDDFEGDYQEDTSIVEGGDNYICGDQGWYVNSCYEDFISLPSFEPKLLEDDYVLGYVCPINYSCYEEEGTIYCQENMSGQYKCKSNLSVGEKGLRDNMGEYSCSNSVNTYSCDWNEDEWKFECEEPSTAKYSCEFDGKNGYECTKNEEGTFECKDYGSMVSSIYGGYICYDDYNDVEHPYCSISTSSNGYFCPVRWGTKFNTNGDYECLAEGAEFNEDLGQCVYTVTGYDGENIIIMASNLGVTEDNLTGLYYQWGTGYGFPGYNGDIDDNRINAPLDGIDRTTFNDYDVDEILWPSDADPCPTKFHLPSTTEWNNLLISWCEDTAECDAAELTKHYSLSNHWALSDVRFEGSFEDEVYSFMDDLNFPLGGSRDADYVNMLGFMGDYWAKEFYGTGNSRGFTVYPEGGLGALPFISNHGVQVRCFADIEEDEEISTPVALDLYIGGCAQQDMFRATSAIEVLEDSMLCNNDGYRGRKFVPAGEEVKLVDLDGFLPTGYQWVWYLDDNKENKLEDNTPFTNDTRLYVFQEESLDEYTITFDSNGGTPTPAAQSIVYGSKATEPTNNPTKNGYTFGGWMLDGVEFNFSTSIVGSITLTAKWDVLHYNITYKDGETEVQGLEPSSYTVEDNVTLPTLPTKTGYKFDGWSDNGTKITKIQAGNTGNKTLVAIWTEDKPSGGNSGGYSGGGSPSKPSSKGSGPSSTEVESKGDGPDTPAKEGTKTEPKPVVVGKADNYTGKVNPNQELFDAYEWAYANGLTKYGNMSDARMNDILNRQEMAKITTIFASKFKNNTPNEAKRDFCSKYPDLWKTTEDMQEFIIQSCELGYMGYRANGIDALDRFRPYTPVSVAEVSIILSRIMWQNKYAINENLRYQGHLHAVYEYNLLDNISKPFDYILRKDAYIMLYRISKTL